MIKAIIFDCFGVIITDALEAAIQKFEADDPKARRVITDIIRANNLGMMDPAESNRQIADYLGISVAEWRHIVEGGEVKDRQLMEWILELRKSYKTALLSNVGRGSIQRRFTDDELQSHFDAVVISGEIGVAKPDPAIYEYAAKELGLEPAECVFLDDREGHCRGASDVGMHTICYQNLRQAQSDLKKLLAARA